MEAQVAILTNGSRPQSWWLTMVDLFDEVIISYHHERAEPEHLLAVLRIATERTRVQLNVVIDPAAFDQTMTLAAAAEAQTSATVNRKVMFLDGWKRPADYTNDQRRRLADALARERTTTGTVLKGRLLLGRDAGGPRIVSPLQLIEEGLNRWEGWTCEIGQTTLLVRFDEVWRAACRVGGPVGTIYDRNLGLPAGAVRCTAASCTCIAGDQSRQVTSGSRRHQPCPVRTLTRNARRRSHVPGP